MCVFIRNGASGWKENNAADSCVTGFSDLAASVSGVAADRRQPALCSRESCAGDTSRQSRAGWKGDGDHGPPLAETHLGLFRNP